MQGACAGKLVAATHKQINKHFRLPPSHLNHSLPPTCGRQLPHVCIHQRPAGGAILPAPQGLSVGGPGLRL
jgi:hypothetical protein